MLGSVDSRTAPKDVFEEQGTQLKLIVKYDLDWLCNAANSVFDRPPNAWTWRQ